MKEGSSRKTTYIKTFSVKDEDQSLIEKFEELKWKERVSFSDLIVKAIGEYYRSHGDGNPNFTLDQFDQKDFKACPALFRKREVWEKYYKNLTEGEYKELDQQLNLLLNIHNRNIK